MSTQDPQITIKPNGRVLLTLPEKDFKSVRQIGYIKDRTFCTAKKQKHLYRQLNGFGLCYKLLSEGGIYFDKIKIEYGFKFLETTREFYLAHGKFKHYQNNDLEKQIFLPLEQYGMDKVEEWKIKNSRKGKPINADTSKLQFQFEINLN